ncbi:MAG: Valine--tRNA ligase [Myxococcota bacterium]|nr:Valine--tRNA ligase [Myxococcota bacterium]
MTESWKRPLDKAYDPAHVEEHWYSLWNDAGLFRADAHSGKPPYCIVIPPPNVTGSLHMGHALMLTIQDVLIRWRRMQGYNTLWLPGTDHAGIATQMMVERELKKKEGKDRHSMGRAEFLKRVWEWKHQYGNRIGMQTRVMGASVDWSRERFTMDEGFSAAVKEVFVRLYEEGLIYRAQRLINWDPQDQTALSDLEVDHEENFPGELFSFAYPLSGGQGEIVVSTTRPETMLGDTAIAVHPEDERYRALIGKTVKHPFVDRHIPIIGDAILVDPAFGTGAVKVTPAHDFNDFETGQRHNLPMITVLDLKGRMNNEAGEFAGLDRFEAREKVKARLEELGLARGVKPHQMAIARSQRGGTILEPMLSTQWFVRAKPLADPAIAAVESGKTVFVPKAWEKTYFDWMYNIRDWCISRQLWWGHQIPAWLCADCGGVTVSRGAPQTCRHCGSQSISQDPDVLDTWFSSALWPFATMGWPEHTPDLKAFYPNAVMETGFDIIFFWVARMMMMGIHFMGDVPFRTVFLHAMVRDAQGHKMSKTRGNIIDPLDLTAKHGADALRFTLASMAAQGRDIKMSEQRVQGYRHFANKIWQASRFALTHLEGFQPAERAPAPRLFANRWILSRAAAVTEEANRSLEAFDLAGAALTIYNFLWKEVCDWHLELIKPVLYSGGEEDKRDCRETLVTVFDTALRLLHPFMPFVTEELWQHFPARGAREQSIMASAYPAPDGLPRDAEVENDMALLQEAISALRAIRGESNIPPGQKLSALLSVNTRVDADRLRVHEASIRALAGLENLVTGEKLAKPSLSLTLIGERVSAYVPAEGVIDVPKEIARLEKELGKCARDLEGCKRKLSDEQFVRHAPADVVEKERERVTELETRLARLEVSIRDLKA